VFLFTKTFLAEGDGRAIHGGASLETKVVRALENITGHKGKPAHRANDTGVKKQGLLYWRTPRKLDAERDGLKDGWHTIWRHCTIEFDKDETGASISGLSDDDPTAPKRIRIGPFFLREGFSTRDLEKIVLHEFLHAAFVYGREFHHGMMEQVLIYNLGYERPANPAGTD